MGLFGNNSQTSTTINAPWKGAQPYLTQAMKAGQKLFNQKKGFNAPGFDTYVPFSDQTKTALSGIEGIAGQGNPLAGQSMSAISGILGGDISQKYSDLLSQTDNPHWEQAVQNESDKIANDVMGQFSSLGRTGSFANADELVGRLGDYRTQALSDRWDANIANQRGILGDMTNARLNAVAAAPGAYQQQYLPAERMAQVGAANEDLATRQLQSRLDKFNTKQSAPWNRLQAYLGTITGASGGTGSQTATVQGPSNWAGGLLGGGLLGSQIGSQFGMGGAGAGVGGLLGLLSGL